MLVNRGILYPTTLLRHHHHKEELLSLHQSRQDKLISLPDIENAHKDISHNGDVGENWGFSKVQLETGTHSFVQFLTSRQDKMKFTASSGVKTLKRPSQASKMNLQYREEIINTF